MVSGSFLPLDFIIFVTIIAASICIGIYHACAGGRQRTTSEFHMGNRKLSILPVAISLIVSFESSIMMLGIPAEIYVFGIQNIIGAIAFFIAHLLSIKIIVPLIHPLQITSTYEYLELRFQSHAVRMLGTVLGMINNVLYMGIVLFGPAIALEAVMGFPQYASILFVAVGAVIYTTLGGIKAVIWTDVLQSIIMVTGMLAVLIKGTMLNGGVAETFTTADDHGRFNWFIFDTDLTTRHTFWNLFFGSFIMGTGMMFKQASVQRICSTPSLKDAKRVMMIVSPLFLITVVMACLEGIVAYSYYDTIGCDPLKSKQISNPNQIIPYMVMDIFRKNTGMLGLFMASLFSASLSTLSSGLGSVSAVFWQDIVKPHTKPMSEFKGTLISKLAVVFFGMLTVGVAFLVSMIGGTLTQISGTILSACGGPLTGLFLLGCLCPWANSKGAYAGTLSGMALITWITTGRYISPNIRKPVPLPSAPIDQCLVFNSTLHNITSTTSSLLLNTTGGISTDIDNIPTGIDYFYSIGYPWYGVIGVFTVLLVGSIVSFLTGYTKPKQSDAKYLVSLTDELFFFLPEVIKSFFRFGYKYNNSKKCSCTKEDNSNVTEYCDKDRQKGDNLTEYCDKDCKKGDNLTESTVLRDIRYDIFNCEQIYSEHSSIPLLYKWSTPKDTDLDEAKS